jgi:hypothetical protein
MNIASLDSFERSTRSSDLRGTCASTLVVFREPANREPLASSRRLAFLADKYIAQRGARGKTDSKENVGRDQ